jgi:hypothetical protein
MDARWFLVGVIALGMWPSACGGTSTSGFGPGSSSGGSSGSGASASPDAASSDDAASSTTGTGEPPDGATASDDSSAPGPIPASEAGSDADGKVATSDAGGHPRWTPSKNTTFYWDLSNAPPDNTKNVGAYDIDGWNNSASEVATLHAKGLKVVCYMDVGTYEPGRPDTGDFPASLKGSAVQGWPGELWLDVRPSGPNYPALQSIMLARFKVCQSKGFDAVEPDNMDSYQNSPGFSTSASDQLAFNEWVAQTVHGLGLAVFQKNDLDQIPTLVTYFDGILDEQCNEYSECSSLAPYTKANKPAWDAEYSGGTAFCSADVSAGIVGALFALNLDGSVFQPCSNDVGLHN